MDENINAAPARAGGRYKIKEELRNRDIKIGGVLYEKVIFNRDSETLSNMLDSNEKLVSYLIADEDIDNKEAISSLNKEIDRLTDLVSNLQKENNEWRIRLERVKADVIKAPEKAIEKIVLNDEGMGNPL